MKIRLGMLILVLSMWATISIQAQEDSPALQRVRDVEFIAWVTGPDSDNHTDTLWDVDGTDLGSMFALDDVLYIAFGDTFGCCRPASGGAGGDNWRNNVLAYSTDRELDDGLTLDGMVTDANGHARAVLVRKPGDVTIIPTDGIVIGGRLYLHYMAVKSWGAAGEWTLNRSGWAYSDDGGESWTQPEEAIWPDDTNFGQVALIEYEGYIYVFGIPGGRFGGVALARVATDAILDMSAYTYWDGQNWASDLEQAVIIASEPVGELSVAWNDYLDRWIMTYLDESKAAIVIREAPALTGPWHDPVRIVTGRDYPALYGAYLHPWASDSEVIYFTMSQWGPYNVRLMRARLVRRE